MLKKFAIGIIFQAFSLSFNGANAQSITPAPQKQASPSQKVIVDISKPISFSSNQPININLPNPVIVNSPAKDNWIRILKEFSSALSPLVGLFALTFGVYSYNKQNRWKRLEFLVQEYKLFEENPKIRNVFWMLDWSERHLYFEELADENKTRNFNLEILESSFDARAIGQYSDTEVAIRDCFDEFFTKLDRLNTYMDIKVIEAEDLKPYLEYWLKIIANTKDAKNHKSLNFYEGLWSNFINRYGFKTEEILKKFNIQKNTKDDHLSLLGSVYEG